MSPVFIKIQPSKFGALYLVAGIGVEPLRTNHTRDFKYYRLTTYIDI